jgi:predicted O-methyltransferase YrrM
MSEPRRYTTFPGEKALLAWLLSRSPGSVGVEIGVHEGYTTEWLAMACPQKSIIAIDPWHGKQDGAGDDMAQPTMRRLATIPNVTVWRASSHDVEPPEDLGFVFHDGDHRDVSDFPIWWRALIPGGVLAIHDTVDPGWPLIRPAAEALGPPWHVYAYTPGEGESKVYGPSLRGLWWKFKA